MGEARAVPKWPPRKPLLRVKAQHHTVAQLLTQGRKVVEISRQTGYSPTYVSRIRKDPVMHELLVCYAQQREGAFAHTLRREMEIVAGLDELRERLAHHRARKR